MADSSTTPSPMSDGVSVPLDEKEQEELRQLEALLASKAAEKTFDRTAIRELSLLMKFAVTALVVVLGVYLAGSEHQLQLSAYAAITGIVLSAWGAARAWWVRGRLGGLMIFFLIGFVPMGAVFTWVLVYLMTFGVTQQGIGP